MSALVPEVSEENYRYVAIIDAMLVNPHMKRYEIAAALGYTAAWFSTVTSSDAFKVMYAKRREEYNGEFHESTVHKLYEVAQEAADVVLEKLKDPECPADLAVDSMTASLKSLGFGAPKSVQPSTQNNTQINVYTEADRQVLSDARERMTQVSKLVPTDEQALPALEGK